MNVNPEYAGKIMALSGRRVPGVQRHKYDEFAIRQQLNKKGGKPYAVRMSNPYARGKLTPSKELKSQREKKNNPDLGLGMDELYSRSKQDMFDVELPPKEIKYLSSQEQYYERFGTYPRQRLATKQDIEARIKEMKSLSKDMDETLAFAMVRLRDLGYKVDKPSDVVPARTKYYNDALLKNLTDKELLHWERIKKLPPDASIPEARKIMRSWTREGIGKMTWEERKFDWLREKVLSEDTLSKTRNEVMLVTRPDLYAGVTTGVRKFTIRKPSPHFYEWIAKLTDNFG